MRPGDAMAGRHEPTPAQKRGAVISAVVLAFLAVAIYATFMLKLAL
ncbi:MAG: hypothetical protein AB7I06_17220 [Burkholderiales bacterium]